MVANVEDASLDASGCWAGDERGHDVGDALSVSGKRKRASSER
jgi:hypothetical protein